MNIFRVFLEVFPAGLVPSWQDPIPGSTAGCRIPNKRSRRIPSWLDALQNISVNPVPGSPAVTRSHTNGVYHTKTQLHSINICKMKRFQHFATSYHSPLSGLSSIRRQNDDLSCPVDPDSIQGSPWPISLTRNYVRIEYARSAYFVFIRYHTWYVFIFLGMLLSGGRGFSLALSAAGQARGAWVHSDARLDPGRAPWRCSGY